jgi:hypothetical protein
MNVELALVFVFTVMLTGGMHVPLAQMSGATQSAVTVQVVLQAPVPHMYGLHMVVAGVTHVLLVLQVEAGVSVLPVEGQLAAAH